MSRYYRSFLEESVIIPSYTTRTTAFASATGITDTTILGALNTFDLGLISNSLDTKMKAIYPFVGTTATTQKYNFMDARDLDVAFRLTFYGGGTFSSNGYQPNGTNAYADTFYKNLTNNSSIWMYSRTSSILTTEVEMGLFGGDVSPWSNTVLGANNGGNTTFALNSFSGGNVIYPATTTQGFFGSNRTSSTVLNGWHNGIKKGTNTNASSATSTVSVYVGGYNNGPALNYPSSKELAISIIGDGLTDTEASTLYTLTQAMQTTLGRQV